MDAFDDRLINIKIELSGEEFTYDQNYYIIATGCKYTNGNFGECNIRIDNISKKARDFFTTNTARWRDKRENAVVSLNIGRKSFGTFQVFKDGAIACNPSQPPDIGLNIRSLGLSTLLGMENAFSAPSTTKLSNICQQVATSIGATLSFEATNDPVIGNHTFTGAVAQQIKGLNDLADIDAHVDDSSNTLVVTDSLVPRKITPFELSSSTGMIGVPEITEIGVRVKMLIRGEISIGQQINLTSKLYPAVNGAYKVIKLAYIIASRETPFYYILDLRPAKLAIGF